MGKMIDGRYFCRTIFIMKRGRGRPPKPSDERKQERLEVRADSADKRQLEEAAERSGLKLSDWIRDRLKSAATAELNGTVPKSVSARSGRKKS